MKKYLLPTLVSLALSSPVLLAEETPAANKESTPPMLAQPPAHRVAPPANMMQKNMEKMRAHEEKMRQEHAKRMQEERQHFLQSRLMELQQQTKEIQAMIDSPPPEMNGKQGNMPNRMGNRQHWNRPGPMHDMMGRGMNPRKMDRMERSQSHHQRVEALLEKTVELLEKIAGQQEKAK